jgi:hypothetical protein
VSVTLPGPGHLGLTRSGGVISSLLPWMTCTRAGSPGPFARRARPVHSPLPGETSGAHHPGHTPGRGRARRGPGPARDLRPLMSASDAPTGWGEPEGVSESVTASPDQPVNGRLACAGEVCCASRGDPPPAVRGSRDQLPSAWADCRCAGVPRLDPGVRRAIGTRCRPTGPSPSQDWTIGRGVAVPAHPMSRALPLPPSRGDKRWVPGPHVQCPSRIGPVSDPSRIIGGPPPHSLTRPSSDRAADGLDFARTAYIQDRAGTSVRRRPPAGLVRSRAAKLGTVLDPLSGPDLWTCPLHVTPAPPFSILRLLPVRD